jgi:hypothetical protein
MALRCEEVRELMAPTGAPLPLSDERAGLVAEHLDQCDDCDLQLSRRVGEILNAFPVIGSPSLSDVRRRARDDRRQSTFLRSASAAAALLVILGTGWALLRGTPAAPSPRVADRSVAPPPVEAPIPDPPKLTELREIDRNLIQSEGVLALYLQFSLSCLNNPTDEDKREFLIRALLVLREVRGAMRSQYERGGTPQPDVDTVTRNGLSEALRTMRASPLPSVKLLPAKINAFKFEDPQHWRVDHLLGTTGFRLTLAQEPSYLNFSYLKLALGADDALLSRIEDALWFDVCVNLPKRQLDKDPSIAPRALEILLPLLSPRQQRIYRKIVEGGA